MKLEYEIISSVFGDRLFSDKTELQIAKNGNIIQYPTPKKLVDFLEGEKKALNTSESPKIVKLRGYQIFVDKGRAWGPTIGDRIKGVETPNLRGHVIGFYGPENPYTSPDGYKVNEGAIILARYGIQGVKTGQSLTFDEFDYSKKTP